MSALSDAISTVETASGAYNNALTQTSNDQATAQQIQAKLDAANNQVQQDQQAQDAAAQQFNAALDQLIQAATAAKIPPSTPPAAGG